GVSGVSRSSAEIYRSLSGAAEEDGGRPRHRGVFCRPTGAFFEEGERSTAKPQIGFVHGEGELPSTHSYPPPKASHVAPLLTFHSITTCLKNIALLETKNWNLKKERNSVATRSHLKAGTLSESECETLLL
ncbi:hypothetical protein CEXT_125381, partial [Caerostris extrusa]